MGTDLITSVDSGGVRSALGEATAALLATGAALGPDDWDRPATDRWTVRQLFVHVVRSLAVVGEYLDADLPADGPALAGAAGYYRTALAHPGSHDGIAGRAEAAADSFGDDPVTWAGEVVDGRSPGWRPPRITGRSSTPPAGSGSTTTS